jgi:membrane protease YdiL (CAAX protease family)
LIFTSLQSVLYTVVFIRTKGSLLPALLLHAGTDIAPRVFQLTRLPTSFWLIVDLTLGLAVTALLLGLRRQISSVQQGTWADATNREGPF